MTGHDSLSGPQYLVLAERYDFVLGATVLQLVSLGNDEPSASCTAQRAADADRTTCYIVPAVRFEPNTEGNEWRNR